MVQAWRRTRDRSRRWGGDARGLIEAMRYLNMEPLAELKKEALGCEARRFER
jgi:hypothetical protein